MIIKQVQSITSDLSFTVSAGANSRRGIRVKDRTISFSGSIVGQVGDATNGQGISTSSDVSPLTGIEVLTLEEYSSINVSGNLAGTGVRFREYLGLNNYGSVYGSDVGIFFEVLEENSTVTFTNTGTVSGGNYGIYLDGGNTSTLNINMHGGSNTGNIAKEPGNMISARMFFGNNATSTINNNIEAGGMGRTEVAAGATAVYNGSSVNINARIVNDGTIVLSENTNLNPNNYEGSGTLKHTIGESSYATMTVEQTADLTNSSIVVVPNYSAPVGTNWTLITATTLTTNSGTSISLQDDRFLELSTTITGTSLAATLSRSALTPSATSGINSEVSQVIDQMSSNATNPQQEELANIFANLTSASALNDALHKMIPNQNYSQQSIQVQNSIFSRAETRIAALQHSKIGANNSSLTYAAGDIDSDTAVWLAGLGTSANQRDRGMNEGYKSNSAGFMFGIDHLNHVDNVFGVAFGNSNSNIEDKSNANFNTKVIGYHGLVYSSINLCNNKYLEWLINGSINKNLGTRAINIDGNNLTTNASYTNFQIGSKFNYGKNCCLTKDISIAPLLSLQYMYLNKPTYTKTGSVAALRVEQNGGTNLITIGAGARLSFTSDNWWAFGSRNLRAAITYDALSPSQDVVSSFVIGSNGFAISSNPSRLAMRVGADFGFQILSNVVLDLVYDYEVRKDFSSHSGMLKFKYIF